MFHLENLEMFTCIFLNLKPINLLIFLLFIVTVMLTFTVLWLSPLDKERLILSYINLFAHLLQLQNICWQIPLKGENVPLLSKSIFINLESCLLSLLVTRINNLISKFVYEYLICLNI